MQPANVIVIVTVMAVQRDRVFDRRFIEEMEGSLDLFVLKMGTYFVGQEV